MPREAFDLLHYLPDPVPGEEGHYKCFSEVFGTSTTEEFRPSLQVKKSKKSLPFTAGIQHVKNVIQCEECEMWRLVYSKFKLTPGERKSLQKALDEFTYTCGAQLEDLNLNGRLKDGIAMRLI